MTVSTSSDTPTRPTRRAKPKYRRLVLRPLLDAAIAGVVFTLVSSTFMCTHAKAGIIPAAFSGVAKVATAPTPLKTIATPGPLPFVQIATASSPGDAVYRETSVSAAWGLLGVAFSVMAALNLAMLRHLKRAYAVPARRFPLRNKAIG